MYLYTYLFVILFNFISGNKSALKKFAIAFVLCLQNQFSSSFAFVNYLSHIFVESGSTLDPQQCMIFTSVVQIIGTLFASILVEKFGRKTLMLASTAGMALGMFGFGAFVQFTDSATKAEYNWVPLMAVAFVVISLTFKIIVEILPAKVIIKLSLWLYHFYRFALRLSRLQHYGFHHAEVVSLFSLQSGHIDHNVFANLCLRIEKLIYRL